MKFFTLLLVISIMLSLLSSYRALYCKLNNANPYKVAKTIIVGGSKKAKFKKVQDAINSIPMGNSEWIRILVLKGEYWEKVTIPTPKSCIFLEGVGMGKTNIRWNEFGSSETSATFTSFGENIVVKGITFENTFRPKDNNDVKPALAALVAGDKSVFYECAFIGIQDTLSDMWNRHYFKACHIEGSIDFIFGNGQSIYEDCHIVLNLGRILPTYGFGSITAQGRENPSSPGGFVFLNCNIFGVGKASLGRAWTRSARVIFSDTQMADVIAPGGWEALAAVGHESDTLFAEVNSRGRGATGPRVRWVHRLSKSEAQIFLTIRFIDGEGWMRGLPNIYSTRPS